MKTLNYDLSRLFVIPFMLFFIMGCASEPVKIDLPATNPANPAAQEAEFIPPQNPFQTDTVVMHEESEKDSMMNHEPQKETGMQHMVHDMEAGQEGHTESESKMDPDHKKSNHQHQEHGQ